MKLAEKKNILNRLGVIMNHLGDSESWPGYSIGINQEEYDQLNELIQRVHIYNGWFKEEQVRSSFKAIAGWLNEESLNNWLAEYNVQDDSGKKVAIIMAGNIPLVGFHDFISVFLAGHKASIKLSSEDQHLLPALIKTMMLFDENMKDWVEIANSPLQGFDAVIATGSDNSSRYFESYFGKYPNIIRKNRSSIAFIDGTETKEELKLLGEDIFHYYGLGCRNVSQLWIPENFELDRFFEAIYDFNEIIHHNKYANNYDYNKAVMLLNKENLLDNGFILLKEDDSLHSPLAVLHYVRYKKPEDFERFVDQQKDQIQLIVGKNYIPFGHAQVPSLTDYADGVDTMQFLVSLYVKY
ncbi:acyl-CoA reductase [Paracrocinitomix mangrovi]|uniref:acyl-CoA reductase n=1 Tax=Paracrocinitomix mangrovi TaxID=2862509 RepID=UPI001C8DB2FA|nr:acyl-CoA reductase [Paracrocinitomix mangrovi]UKN02527.1 acyl-CoA reductase [Paracrocinitomix mangrovi]